MILSGRPAPIAWHPWSADAFQRAEREHKPVLLAIGAAWCPWSAEMDRVTYTDPAVAALIETRFVPVRVDADHRPDVSDRYCLGGWPTTAFLTPAGDVLGGATFLTAAQLVPLLERIAEAFDERRGLFDGGVHRAATLDDARQTLAMGCVCPATAEAAVPVASQSPEPAGREPDADFEAWLCDRMIDEFDAAHGGFGAEPKLVYADAIRVAVARWRDTGDPRLEQMATATLDAMAGGPLWDVVSGGFSRYADGRDWSRPHREKLLATQADLLHAYLDAWQAFGRSRDRAQAIEIVRFVHATLADRADGGFYASQQPDRDAGAVSPAAAERPAVDRSLYADGNGLMAAAYAHAADLLDDTSLVAFAAQSIDRVVVAAYERGRGVAHDADTGAAVRGLLADQVYVAAALLDIHDATGQAVYLDMAQELMLFALRCLWDRREGGFVDRAPGDADEIGLLREPLKPFAANCEAARTLARIARATGRSELAERASETLASQRAVARRHGLHAAPYALAWRAVAGSCES